MPEKTDELPKLSKKKTAALHDNLIRLKADQELLETLPQTTQTNLDNLIATSQSILARMTYNNLSKLRMVDESLYELYRDVTDLLQPEITNKHPELETFVNYPKMKELEKRLASKDAGIPSKKFQKELSQLKLENDSKNLETEPQPSGSGKLYP